MRVLLAVPWYFPESIGGTEVYVRGLARELLRRGVDVAVATPAAMGAAPESVEDGVQVFRFAGSDRDSAGFALDAPEPRGWSGVLDRFKPDVVDFHALTSSLELPHVKAAHRRGMASVITLHVPDVICARGTFMRFGTEPCSGDLAHEPCTACRLEAKGIPPLMGRLVEHVPHGLATALDASPLPGSARRTLTAGLKDELRREWLQQLARHADRLVAPSQWLVDVLRRNRIEPSKIVLCRQGVETSRLAGMRRRTSAATISVGFVGRYDPVKGLHVLIDAVRLMPDELPLELHVWGIARSDADHKYRQEILQRIQGSSRVTVHAESTDTRSILGQIDVLAVPSLWLETGPLVVLEAQAAGIPIVGSNLGGITERVVDGEDGLLVPSGDPQALAAALRWFAEDPRRVDTLRPKHTPRTVEDLAGDTLTLYRALGKTSSALPSMA